MILAGYIFLTALQAGVGHLDNPKNRVRGGDSAHYYVYLPALVIGGDLDFTEELNALTSHPHRFKSATDRPGNPYSVGPALLWAPFFLVSHIIVYVFGGWPTDGLSPPYQAAVYVGNSIVTAVGLLFTARFLQNLRQSTRATLVAVGAVIFATQLTYYLWSISATSHGTSFAAVALFAWSVSRYGVTWKSGLCGGLAAIVRWQNILIVAPVAVALHIRDRGYRFERKDLNRWVSFLLASGIALSPQIIVWLALYGTPFLVPQGEGFVDLTRLPLVRILTSIQHGLFTWHPVLLFGVVGITILYRGHPGWATAIGVAFALQWVMNASILDWWATWSFGHRRFVNLLPFFALGIAVVYDRVSPALRRCLACSIVVLAIWNQLFLYQYQRGLIPRSKSPTLTEFFIDKLQLSRVAQAQLHVNNAVYTFERDKFALYIEEAEKAYDVYPGYRNAWRVYSVASATLQRYETAEQLFRKWTEEDPNNLVANWGLGAVLVKQGDSAGAERLFEKNQWSRTGAEVLSMIRSGEQSLMNRRFFDFYRAELDSMAYIH